MVQKERGGFNQKIMAQEPELQAYAVTVATRSTDLMDDTDTLLRDILTELQEQTRVLLKLESAVDQDQADLWDASNDED